jgi:hypothetical protein
MNSKETEYVYENTNFLSLSKTSSFTYEFNIEEKTISSIADGKEIGSSLFELLILNLLNTNSLINRKTDPNWVIITHRYLEKNFNKLTTDKFKFIKPNIKFSYLYYENLEKITKDNVKTIIELFDNFLKYVSFIQEGVKPDTLTKKSISKFCSINLMSLKGLKKDSDSSLPIYRIFEG